MIAKDLISDIVLPLKASDTGLVAMHWFDEFRVLHLPVIHESQLLGIISEDEIYNAGTFEEPIRNYLSQLQNVSVLHTRHIYEVMKLFADFKLTALPVVDEKGIYLGVITLVELMNYMAKTTAVSNPGGILVLETSQIDYSMIEISKIVEENDAKILSMFVSSPDDSIKVEITLKLNKIDIQHIIQTFLRYDYTIKASFFESDYFDNLRDRYDLLMAYLNV